MDFEEAYPDTCSSVSMAARTGKVELLKKMIRQGKSVDVKDNRGWHSLHEAAYHGQLECLKVIAKKCTEIDCRTFEEETPLMFACKRGHHECVKHLLEKGADPNSMTLEGLTSLWQAAQKSFECVDLLLKAGANVNSQTFTEETPLHRAVEKDYSVDTHIIKCLLMSGADLSIQDEHALTPLFVAAQFGHLDCLKIFIEHLEQKSEGLKVAVINTVAYDGASPLYLAVQNGHKECAKILLENGADPDVGVTGYDRVILPLQVALIKGYKECTEMLAERTTLEHFSWLNYKGLPEDHPLVVACTQSSEDFLQILIRQPFFSKELSEENGNGLIKLMENIYIFKYDIRIRPAMVLFKLYEPALRTFFCSRDFVFEEYEALSVSNGFIPLNNEFIRDIDNDYFPVFVLILRLGVRPYLLRLEGLAERRMLLYWCAVMKYSLSSCQKCTVQDAPLTTCCHKARFSGDCSRVTVIRTLLAVLTAPQETVMREELVKEDQQSKYSEVIDMRKICSLQHLCRRRIILQQLHTRGYGRQSVYDLKLPKPTQSYLLLEDTKSSQIILDGFETLDFVEKYIDKMK